METKEYKKKNGAFCFESYAIVLAGFSVVAICLVAYLFISDSESDYVLAILGLLSFSFFLYHLLRPYTEKYYLDHPDLYVKKGRKVSKLNLPAEYSVIVSSMSIYSAIDTIPFPIYGSYYVSIIDSGDKQKILDLLHKGRGTRYSSGYIENVFQYAYFEGFIYDKTIPDVLFEDAKAVIIPKSALNHIEHGVLFLPNVVIDENY